MASCFPARDSARFATFAGALACAALGACAPLDAPSDAAADHEPSGRSAAAIMGGYIDEADTAVVGIYQKSYQALCSGSLLAPNVVLTAHHCVANSPAAIACATATFGLPWTAPNFLVTTYRDTGYFSGVFPLALPKWHAVSEVLVPPGSNKVCGYDQAILILSEPIGPEEALPLVPAVDEPVLADEEYHAVGYGMLSDNPNAAVGSRYRRDALHVACVGADCPNGLQVADEEFGGDTGICEGDSGGPAIDTKNRVVGVASRGTVGCTSPVYGHVFSWGQWIKDTTLHAAQVMGVTPPPWATGYPTDPVYSAPLGAPCVQPTDCQGGACLAGVCTRPCNAAASCPEGYACAADAGDVCRALPPAPAEEEIITEEYGCAYRHPSRKPDPTKPVPWELVCEALAVLTLARRRRRAARAH